MLDSAEVVGEADPNGCPTLATAVAAPLADERVSVCHYDAGLLVQS